MCLCLVVDVAVADMLSPLDAVKLGDDHMLGTGASYLAQCG